MKCLMVKPGFCVQPTMPHPKAYEMYEHDNNRIVKTPLCEEWESHIENLPKLPTTCTLPAGEWFEGAIRYEHSIMRMPVNDERWWTLCTKAEYEEQSPALSYREVIVPVEQKEKPDRNDFLVDTGDEYFLDEKKYNAAVADWEKHKALEQKDEPKDLANEVEFLQKENERLRSILNAIYESDQKVEAGNKD